MNLDECILTDRCKEDFINYCVENKEQLFNRLLADEVDVLEELNYFNNISLYPIIISFLDTNQYKGHNLFSLNFSYFYNIKSDSYSHNFICEQAIITSNEMYNKYINQLCQHQ